MDEMDKEEEKKLIKDNPHLKKYLDEIEKKMEKPIFYSNLPRSLKGEKFPNIIYPTKNVVFIHIYRTKDMENIEYHAVEPLLNKKEKEKRDRIIDIMYEKAHLRTNIKTQDELRKNIEEVLDEITIIDEKTGGELGKSKRGKIKLTSIEKVL